MLHGKHDNTGRKILKMKMAAVKMPKHQANRLKKTVSCRQKIGTGRKLKFLMVGAMVGQIKKGMFGYPLAQRDMEVNTGMSRKRRAAM
jgi:hypothetical protein